MTSELVPAAQQQNFRFGLETEYLLVDKTTFRPLWYKDLTFKNLNTILEGIELTLPRALEGLELEPPHKKLMPYVVEGYSMVDVDFQIIDLLPKGIEIRTPVCHSMGECLDTLEQLQTHLQTALAAHNYCAVSLSHHPEALEFSGPINKKRHDYWLWAMEVMSTYGPDINVSVPTEVMKEIDTEDLLKKINYYSPCMTAFSLASPFCHGKPWEIHGGIGKSLRTYRRSVIAPMIEIHPHENGRLEFKPFDMAMDRNEYECYFLLFLALLLDKKLEGRASKADRIYEMGAVATTGFAAKSVVRRANALLDQAFAVLPQWGFSTDALTTFVQRLDRKRTPADALIERYFESNQSLEQALRSRTVT